MQLENVFYSCFLLLRRVCVHSQSFSLLACPEDTFLMVGQLAKHDNKANLSQAVFSLSLWLAWQKYYLIHLDLENTEKASHSNFGRLAGG